MAVLRCHARVNEINPDWTRFLVHNVNAVAFVQVLARVDTAPDHCPSMADASSHPIIRGPIGSGALPGIADSPADLKMTCLALPTAYGNEATAAKECS